MGLMASKESRSGAASEKWKNINEDLEVLLFRGTQQQRKESIKRLDMYWYRYVCVGDDDPSVSHKSLYLLNVNATRIIQLVILQQLQSLIHISDLLSTKKHLEQKFRIRIKHSSVVIRNLDIKSTETNREICKFVWKTWTDYGIQNTYHWYIKNHKKYVEYHKSSSSNKNEIAMPVWQIDIFDEFIIYPLFCEHFMHNLNPVMINFKDFYNYGYRTPFHAYTTDDKMIESSKFISLNDLAFLKPLSKLDYLILQKTLIPINLTAIANKTKKSKTNDHLLHWYSLMNYGFVKYLPHDVCLYSVKYQNVPLKNFKECDPKCDISDYDDDTKFKQSYAHATLETPVPIEFTYFLPTNLWKSETSTVKNKSKRMLAHTVTDFDGTSNTTRQIVIFINIDNFDGKFNYSSNYKDGDNNIVLNFDINNNTSLKEKQLAWKTYFLNKLLSIGFPYFYYKIQCKIMLCYNGMKILKNPDLYNKIMLFPFPIFDNFSNYSKNNNYNHNHKESDCMRQYCYDIKEAVYNWEQKMLQCFRQWMV